MEIREGDLVKILKGAEDVGVPEKLVGSIGKVVDVRTRSLFVEIHGLRWFVLKKHVELAKLNLDKPIGEENDQEGR